MDFSSVEAEFERLKAQFEAGEVTEAEFKSQVQELMIEDEQGWWWVIGPETGQWYVHDGEEWVRKEPPRPAPVSPPSHPEQQVGAEPIAGSPPESTVAAPSRPKVGLKLSRDGVSVLLVTAGWFVSIAAFSLLLGRFGMAIGVGIGGLITGLVLRRTEPPTPWRQVPVVVFGWAIGGAVIWFLWSDPEGGIPLMVPEAIGGLVGGLITALALKWTHPFISWKNVVIVTLGWGLGWLLGGAIGETIGESLYWEWYYDGQYYPVVYALSGAIAGATGSWVSLWQFRKARQSSL
jgi:hypothetical protein